MNKCSTRCQVMACSRLLLSLSLGRRYLGSTYPGFRDAVFSHLHGYPATIWPWGMRPKQHVHWDVLLFVWEFPGKQPEELVSGQRSSLLSAPFAHVFLFQLESHCSVSKARVPELPWPQSATYRETSHQQTKRKSVCVCGGRCGVPFACACICLHSHDPECSLG